MEGHERGQQRGEEQQVSEVDEPHRGMLSEEDEHEVGAEFLRPSDDLRCTLADDHRPGGECVEHPDDAHSDDGGPTGRAARIFDLLVVDGPGFEAHEGRDRECQGCADPGCEELVECEAVGGDSFGAVGESDDVEDDDDEEFRTDDDAEHFCGEVDPQHTHDADDDPGDEGADPPGPGDAEEGVEEGGEDEAEHSGDADLHGVVGDERGHRRSHSRGLAQSLRDVGEEGPGVVDVAAHRRIADGEEDEDDPEDDEGQRNPDQAGDGEVAGDSAGDDGQRRRGGDDHEDERGDSDAAGIE